MDIACSFHYAHLRACANARATLGAFDNVKAHLGYEFYPAKLNKSWFWFLTSSTHHNMHHSKFNGNYGVHFRIWDKLLGTEFKEYESEYDKIQARKLE